MIRPLIFLYSDWMDIDDPFPCLSARCFFLIRVKEKGVIAANLNG